MKKKGFTLIELLAVIIILAIIALIATPIIMRVIENSKKGAAERSAENYIREVETVVLALKANGTTLEDGTYGINSNGNLCPNNETTCNEEVEIKIDMSGKKPSSGSIVISNGKVVATGANNTTTALTIEDYTATISENGSVTAKKQTPRYYSWGSGNISDGLPSDANTDLSKININNHPFYLAFDSANGKDIDAAYVCFVRNDIPYCIQGGDGGAAFENNQGILDEAFKTGCWDGGHYYGCWAGGIGGARAYLSGYIFAEDVSSARCDVAENGRFGCNDK